jgi:hypothetical protein
VVLSLAGGIAALTNSLVYPYTYFFPPGWYSTAGYIMMPSLNFLPFLDLWVSASGGIVILAAVLFYLRPRYGLIFSFVITIFSGISIGLGVLPGGFLGAVGAALGLASSRR